MVLISRSFRRRFLRPRPLILIVTILLLLDAMIISNSLPSSMRVSPSTSTSRTQKIFIASMFRNSEYILRLSWTNSLIALVKHLGPQNVYVSIGESGSLENTKGALFDLQAELKSLGVAHHIEVGIDSIEQATMLSDLPPEGQRDGWIFTGRKTAYHPAVGTVEVGKEGWEKRRIPYLAVQRNQVMEPFYEAKNGRWDKILWINDVVFTTEDVTTLLSTRAGHYSAACSLDFNKYPTQYYDTFALRDSKGYKTTSLSWPYFFSSTSRNAIRKNNPVPVQSCWNGMVVFDATPFYALETAGKRLKFRGVDDSLAMKHVEGSECCLIHADNKADRDKKGVWINPNVRVAYATVNTTIDAVYQAVNPEKEGGRWPGGWEAISGIWENRLIRVMGRMRLWSEIRVVKRRVAGWVKEEKREGRVVKEEGLECLVNEMQVMFKDGWQHI